MSPEKSFVFRGAPARLDVFLTARLSPLSRTQVQRLIKDGRVTVAGRPAPARRVLAPGERVAADVPAFSSLPASAADDVPVLFEDDDIIVVNKPPGWVVHPAGPHREDTLIQRLWPKLSGGWGPGMKAGDARPGVVHRLDRGTSGVLVIAKNPAAAETLSRQFADRKVEKIYWAVVEGLPAADRGRVTSPVGRSRNSPHRMSTQAPGRWSETEFRVLRRFSGQGDRGLALLEVLPKTGRTHQIRVQLSSLGHPVAGDHVYDARTEFDRPLLHARSLSFCHPVSGKALTFDAPPPPDFAEFIEGLSSVPAHVPAHVASK